MVDSSNSTTAEASTTSASAIVPTKLFPLGVESGENLLVGYLGSTKTTKAAQPVRGVARGQFAPQRRLGDVRKQEPAAMLRR